MSNSAQRPTGSIAAMLLSAAIFGYFGFGMTFLGFGITWVHQYTAPPPPAQPERLIMVALLMWTLRAGAIGFAFAALFSFVHARAGTMLYGVIGLLAALALLSVAVWDWNTPQYYSGVPPFLLLIFAVWNGYSSWMGLRESGALGGASSA